MVIIYAQHRSGSTLLNNIIKSSDNVEMLEDEVNLYAPLRRKSFEKSFRNPELSVKFLYGSFWKYANVYGINDSELNKWRSESSNEVEYIGKFIKHLKSGLTEGKILGAKYFIHLRRKSKLDLILQNQDISILLIRNINAVINSKLNDASMRRRKEKWGLLFPVIRISVLIYFCLEFNYFAFHYRKSKGSFVLIKYEELCVNRDAVIEKLTKTGVQFSKELDNIEGKPSSFKNEIDRSSGANGLFGRTLIRILTNSARKTFNYD